MAGDNYQVNIIEPVIETSDAKGFTAWPVSARPLPGWPGPLRRAHPG